MKYQIILIGLLSGLFYAQGNSQISKSQVQTKLLSFEEIKEDFDILKGALSTDYPSASRYISSDSVIKLWNKWENSLRSMDERTFFKLIGEITYSFHDEHLIPSISQEFSKNPERSFLPFTIFLQNDAMKVAVVHPTIKNLKSGDEILAINGHTTKEIISEVSKRMHHDGYITSFIERHFEDFSPTQSFNYFDRWYGVLYEDHTDNYEVLIRNDLDTLSLKVNSLNRKDYMEFYWSRMSREAPAHFEILKDTIGYLKVSSFHGWYRNKHKQNFKNFFGRTFKSMRDKNIRTLILDLRLCEGGDDSNKLLLQYLIDRPFKVYREMYVTFSGKPRYSEYYDNQHLELDSRLLVKIKENWYATSERGKEKISGLNEIEPKKDVFRGKIVVMTSGATGSAAAIVSAMLKTYTEAVFIGEETGGAVNGPTALMVPVLVLPNSKIRVEIPFVQMHLNVENPDGRGVIPDIEIPKRDLSNQELLELINLIP